LFIRKRARADLAEAFAWYEERSTGLGHEFLRAAHVSFAAIERDPVRFPIARSMTSGSCACAASRTSCIT